MRGVVKCKFGDEKQASSEFSLVIGEQSDSKVAMNSFHSVSFIGRKVS